MERSGLMLYWMMKDGVHIDYKNRAFYCLERLILCQIAYCILHQIVI